MTLMAGVLTLSEGLMAADCWKRVETIDRSWRNAGRVGQWMEAQVMAVTPTECPSELFLRALVTRLY